MADAILRSFKGFGLRKALSNFPKHLVLKKMCQNPSENTLKITNITHKQEANELQSPRSSPPSFQWTSWSPAAAVFLCKMPWEFQQPMRVSMPNAFEPFTKKTWLKCHPKTADYHRLSLGNLGLLLAIGIIISLAPSEDSFLKFPPFPQKFSPHEFPLLSGFSNQIIKHPTPQKNLRSSS